MANRQTPGRIGPPYTFKLVKGKGEREKITALEPCTSYTFSRQWDEEGGEDGEGEQTGWELMLTRRAPSVGETVYLPQDGHTVYVENLNGKTVHTFRWPEKDKSGVRFTVMDEQDRQKENLS